MCRKGLFFFLLKSISGEENVGVGQCVRGEIGTKDKRAGQRKKRVLQRHTPQTTKTKGYVHFIFWGWIFGGSRGFYEEHQSRPTSL